jgi:hypothetical protein
MNSTPSWKAHAWSHWHRPWSIMHAAWHETEPHVQDAGADDWALRLHYPAWCERHGLAPLMQEFDDNVWWQLLGLPAEPFDHAVRRVGLALMFAADPRTRLQRRQGNNVAIVRWALGRAPFVPESVADAVRRAQLPSSACAHAVLSLRWCLVEMPELRARLRLRFDPSDVHFADTFVCEPEPSVRAWLATLWAGGVHAAYQENRS